MRTPSEIANSVLDPTIVPLHNEEYHNMILGRPYNPEDAELQFLRRAASHNWLVYNSTSLGDVMEAASKNQPISLGGYSVARKEEYVKKLSDLRSNFIRENHLVGKIGKGGTFDPPIYVDYGVNIMLGDNFYCNANCVFLDCSLIEIGNNVMLGPGVNLLSATHALESKERNYLGTELAKPIKIGDECWLGANVVVNPGVVLGKRCVVASGAVVTKSFPDDCLLAGIPAKIVKTIDQTSGST